MALDAPVAQTCSDLFGLTAYISVLALLDGDLCNRVERTDNTLRPLPVIRLPAVECTSKVIGTDMAGSRRERLCSANYCHMTKTEAYFF
uniref:Secreted protein n=1 Tax=Heterorhabditis bacteriophora TaxID=37862 RepID=A0A1I7XLI8_HETBA